ncbi:24581_t:CDS:1, partial [Gigaspora rosea]
TPTIDYSGSERNHPSNKTRRMKKKGAAYQDRRKKLTKNNVERISQRPIEKKKTQENKTSPTKKYRDQ